MSLLPPNILWLVTTQWRAQACGYMEDVNARTPVLNVMATRSVNYTQAVTPHPFGPFARAALITGVPSPENGVRDYFDPLPADARTIAHRLGGRGYATAWFGKWHLWKRDPEAPLVGEEHARIVVPAEARGGFEFWEGFESGFVLNDPWLHGTRLRGPTRFIGYQADVLADRFELWLEDQAADPRPWFCVVSFESPHPPYDEPAGLVAAGDPETVRVRPNVAPGDIEYQARRDMSGYYAHIAATDRAIGQILSAMQGQRRRNDTISVFTSVHGDMHGAHGLFRKGWPHEESVRVPLLVDRPGGPRGVRSEEVVSLLDLPEMSLAWAAGEVWRSSRGFAEISMPSVVPVARQCDRVWRGLRTPAQKVIFDQGGQPWLVYDLARDPYEMYNLMRDPASGPMIVAARARLEAGRNATASAGGPR
jgi:arylsulfatase A-like enzyme